MPLLTISLLQFTLSQHSIVLIFINKVIHLLTLCCIFDGKHGSNMVQPQSLQIDAWCCSRVPRQL